MSAPFPVDEDTLRPEREHLERSLAERFNFFLVFFALTIGTAFASNDTMRSAVILALGTVIGALLTIVLIRTNRKLLCVLNTLRDAKPTDASNLTGDRNPAHLPLFFRRFTVTTIVGLVIPVVCCVALAACTIAVGLKYL